MNGIGIRMAMAMAALAASMVTAEPSAKPPPQRIRFATFNVSLYRPFAGKLIADLASTNNPQARRLAETIQRVRPDVLLINELDYDGPGASASLFQANYLGINQNGQEPIVYPHRRVILVNTGVASGVDLDGDGRTDGWNDAYGFGKFPGQYGMVVYSMLPIADDQARTFQKFLWKDMPGALLPENPEGEAYYSDEALAKLRLSSKNHADVPIRTGDSIIHFLISHPTPPVFDGPEDRNGRRNHDEIRLWADYVDPARSAYIVDDKGRKGGLPAGARFIIAGDLNADPNDGDSMAGAAQLLTEHPLIDNAFVPSSEGAARAGGDSSHKGDPAQDTAAFAGNLRVDYVLPSKTLTVAESGVFWPAKDAPEHDLLEASDHRLVWVDVVVGR